MKEEKRTIIPSSISSGYRGIWQSEKQKVSAIGLKHFQRCPVMLTSLFQLVTTIIEGSLIGYFILKYACGKKDASAKRMKFSTLMKNELEQAYEEPLPHLDFNLIESGRTRHEVDWLYGINLSRALTFAARHWSGRYSTLSTGQSSRTHPSVSGCKRE